MAKDPAFPWYASDWLGSNTRAILSLEQQGAYMNLLCRQWSDKTCSLPDDDAVLARLSELNEGWFKGGSDMLRPKFPPHPTLEGRVANPRLLELRAERSEWRSKSAAGGRKSGEARRVKAMQTSTSDASKPPIVNEPNTKGGSTTVPTKREPNANQTRTTIKRERKKVTKERKRETSPSPSPSPSPSSSPVIKPPAKPAKWAGELDAVWAYYRTKRPRVRILGDKTRKAIIGRLLEGFTVTDLKTAIDGNFKSPHHCGENSTGTLYHNLDLIVRTAEDVERFQAFITEGISDRKQDGKPDQTGSGKVVRRSSRVHRRNWGPDGVVGDEEDGRDQGTES